MHDLPFVAAELSSWPTLRWSPGREDLTKSTGEQLCTVKDGKGRTQLTI